MSNFNFFNFYKRQLICELSSVQFLHFHKKDSKRQKVNLGKTNGVTQRISTFRIQQPLNSQLVFGHSEGMVKSFHRAQSEHLIPAECARPTNTEQHRHRETVCTEPVLRPD